MSVLGRLAGRVVPRLHEVAFNRDRDRSHPRSAVRLTPQQVQAFQSREPHIVVAALEGPGCESWGPAKGNYYYEIYQSARERFGDDRVSVLDVGACGDPSWGSELARLLRDSSATHLIAHMERDPGLVEQWTWDEVWADIIRWWDGVFIGVMWDSGFDLIQMKGRRLARMSPNLVGLDICVPINDRLAMGRAEVGPVPLLESLETQSLLFSRLESLEKTSDLSFIGALYPYRVQLLENLAARGIRVAVNPHKQQTTSPDKQLDQRPSWLDYMAALASSEMTLNFSLASSGSDEQLKWRVMEATLAGTLLLTDDRSRSRQYFSHGTEFDTFADADDLARVIDYWRLRPDELSRAQAQAQTRARDLATNEFWRSIERVLELRELPSLPTKLSESSES